MKKKTATENVNRDLDRQKSILLTIQQAADVLGVSTKTLRRWDDKGFLTPQRTSGNQRRYTQKSIHVLAAKIKTKSEKESRSIETIGISSIPHMGSFYEKNFADSDQQNKKQNNIGVQDLKPVQVSHPEKTTASRNLFIRTFLLFLGIGLSSIILASIFGISLSSLGKEFSNGLKSLTGSTAGLPSPLVQVLAETVRLKNLNGYIDFNIPANFSKNVTIDSDLLISGNATVSGTLTAPNIVYSVIGGQNITISGDSQNPIISTGPIVSSFQGETGDLELTEGTGITIDGFEIGLTNDFITINPGTGLSGGGNVKLGTSVSLENIGVISITGTANQVIASGSTGDITLSLPQNIDLGASVEFANLDLSDSLTVAGTSLIGGVATFTHQPTLAHTYSPWPTGTSNGADASLYINPASAVADGNLLVAAVNGTTKFVVDAEGDIYGNNLILTGAVTQGSTTVTGDLFVTGNTTLGDAPTDTITFNARFTSGILPALDNTYSLGSPTLRWANVYATTFTGTTVNATNINGAITPTGFTQGSVIFAGSGGTLTQNNANFFWDDTNNRLGIGTSAPTAKLQVAGTTNSLFVNNTNTSFTDLSGTIRAAANRILFAPTTSAATTNIGLVTETDLTNAPSSGYYGRFNHLRTPSSNSTNYTLTFGDVNLVSLLGTGTITAAYGQINQVTLTTSSATDLVGGFNVAGIAGAGSITNLYGTRSNPAVTNAGASVTNSYGVHSLLSNTAGTITNNYGLYVGVTGAATMTNTYGVYVADITTGVQTNTPFSFYASDPGAFNYFAGNVGIGTTAPAQKLHVEGQCVAAGTLIRRRRRRQGKNGEWEEEDIPVEDILPGDEVLSLNDKTGEWEWHTVEKTMDMGIQKTIALTTSSGKRIITTANHPYLTLNKPEITYGTFEVDQSIRIEETEKATIIGIGLGELMFASKLSQQIKREVLENYKLKNQRHVFAYETFAYSVALTFKAANIYPSRMIIDVEYPGFEAIITQLIKLSFPETEIVFAQIGKHSSAHLAAYGVFSGKRKADAVFELKPARNINQRVEEGRKANKKDRRHKALRTVTPQDKSLTIRNPHGLLEVPYHNSKDLSRAKWKKVYLLRKGEYIATVDGFEKITGIQDIKALQTYDLQIEGTHNFVANDIVAHNTYINSTATTAGIKGLEVTQSGAISGTGYGGYFSKTGASTTNVGIYATATGATNNYAAIFESGNVGIGTSAPTSLLHLLATGGIEAKQTIESTGSTGLATLHLRAGSHDFNLTGNRNANLLSITHNEGSSSINMLFDSTASGTSGNQLWLSGGGNVGIGTTTPSSFKLEVAGNIGPEADNTRDLGSASRRWANVYATTFTGTTVNATNINGAITPTGFTQGSVAFAGTGGTLTQDNSQFFWDNTNNRLGIGTTAPGAKLDILHGTAAGTALRISDVSTDATTKQGRLVARHYTNAEENTALLFANNISGSNQILIGGGSNLYNAATQISFYTAADSITTTGTERLRIDSAGNVGIGTTAPTTFFQVVNANTATSGGNTMAALQLQVAPASAPVATTDFVGLQGSSNTTSTNINALTRMFGTYGVAQNSGAGTLGTAIGARASSINISNGTITNAQGLNGVIINSGTGTITNAYALYAQNASNTGGGSITNNYGVYIEQPTTGATNYALYSVGGTNYFGGNVGIGTTNPSVKLDVSSGTAGTPTVTRIRQADNTSGFSHAQHLVEVGGTSGGDPLTIYRVSGATDWSVGVDNSDSDKLKIGPNTAVGTSTSITIQTDGNVGIGTTTPSSLLSVGSTSQFQVNSSGQVTYVDGTANTATAVCKNSSGQLAACNTTGTGAAFVQGGNSFGELATLGTNDANSLSFETNNTTYYTLNTSGLLQGSNGATLSVPGSGTNSEQFGAGASATGNNSLAVGASASATNSNTIALGFGAAVSASDSIAIGRSAIASHANSIAFGRDAATTAGGQLIMGGTNSPLSSGYFGNGVTSTAPSSFVLNATGGSGTNIAGANLTLAAGRGTGTGVGGDLLFQTAAAGGASNATLNTLTTKLIVKQDGNVGIGTTTPSTLLNVFNTNTAISGSNTMVSAQLAVSPASAPGTLTDFVSLLGSANTTSANVNANTRLFGGSLVSTNSGSATLGTAIGGRGQATNTSSGTINVAQGVNGLIQNTSTGTISSATALYAQNAVNSGGGTITNNYGVYIEQPTTGTNNYALYSVGGTNYFGGNVGIGTTSPGAELHIEKNAADARIRLSNVTQPYVLGVRNANNNFTINVGTDINNNIAIAANANRKVGIGGNPGSSVLSINGGLASNTIVLSSSGYSVVGSDASNMVDLSGTWNTTGSPTGIKLNITNTASGANAALMDLQTGGTSRLFVAAEGNVGIGTTAPLKIAHITSTGTSTTLGQLNTNLRLQTNTTTANAGSELSFMGRGGGTATEAALTYAAISAPVTANDLNLGTTGYLAFSTKPLTTSTSLTEAMRIDSSGNVGIGTTGPGDRLHVKIDSNTQVGAIIENTDTGTGAGALLYIRNSTSNNDALRLQAMGSGFTTAGGFVQDGGVISTESTLVGGLSIMTRASAPIRFYTGGHTNERMRIDSAGNVGIGINGPTSLLHIVQTTANQTGLTLSGQSLTTPNAQNLVDLSGTWNTTGSPTGIKLNITNTASGPSAKLIDLQASTQSRFNMDMVGKTTISVTDTTAYTASGTLVNNGLLIHNISAGASVYSSLTLRSNLSGGASSVISGLFEGSNLGAMAFSVQTASSTYVERMRITNGGNVGIGTTAPTGLLNVTKAISGTPSLSGQYLNLSASTFTDNATAASGTAANMVFNAIAVPTLAATNTGVTTTNAASFYIAGAPTAGTNQTITNAYSLWIDAGNARFDGNVGIGTTSPTRTLDITGDVGGNVATDNRATETTTATYTVSTKALAYYLSSNSTTTDSSFATTFNITGLSNTEGSYAFIYTKAEKGATTGPQAHTTTVQINGVQVSTVDTATGTGADTKLENYIIMYANGAWRIAGYGPTAATNTTVDTADLAEWIPYTGDKPQPGEVLTVGDTAVSVKKSQAVYDPKLIGIVTTNPHTVMSAETENSVKLALSGRVPVKVSSFSPAIKSGDYITSSDKPGKAMKATRAGQMIGKALEDWTPGSAKETVMVFVTTSYADPNNMLAGLTLDTNGNLVLPDFDIDQEVTALGGDTAAEPKRDLSWTLSDIVKRIRRLEENQSAQTATGSASLSATNSARLSILEDDIDSLKIGFSDLRSKDQDLAERIASLEADLTLFASGGASLSPTASSSAELSLDKLDAKDFDITGTLRVGGRATLSDIGVTGIMNIGLLSIDGLSENGFATLNTTSGPLKIQSDSINGVDILDGKVVIEPSGNMKVEGTVTVKKLNINTSEVASASLGTAIIQAGTTTIDVTTSALTADSKIFVTAERPAAVGAKANGDGSFTINLTTPPISDLKVNWWIIN